MSASSFSNVHSVRCMFEEIEQILTVSEVFKIDPAQVEHIKRLKIELKHYIDLLDRFNQHFLRLGWIYYESLNEPLVIQAVNKANAGEIDVGEQMLVDYFSPETVEKSLYRAGLYLRAFKPRRRLANLALRDYEEGRYHACVPVVLALVDGLVNKLNKGRGGFFKEDVDVSAWNSFAAHDSGLPELSRVISKSRQAEHTEEILIPYRNGILHGMDLNYDNRTVAAKTWALLFAVVEWGFRVERGQRNAPPTKPPMSIAELIEQANQLRNELNLIEEWNPRRILVGRDVPSNGQTTDYLESSPERTLVDFLYLWRDKNYGKMANLVIYDRNIPQIQKRIPKDIRDTFASKQLTEFEILSIENRNHSLTVIEVLLKYTEAVSQTYAFSLLYSTSEFEPKPRNLENCRWYVAKWQAFE